MFFANSIRKHFQIEVISYCFHTALSAGRVQSVAVRLIVEREREVHAFVSEPSYRVTAVFEVPDVDGQIIALPVEPENPLRTAEMTLEDDYGMIDGVLNNGRRGEELEKAQGEARHKTANYRD